MITSPTQHEPIDIVYLWVDGADPLWQAKRDCAYGEWILKNPDDLAMFGNTAGRYRDNHELLFNLRALEQFFPSYGHIYLVTDGQIPAWLKPSAHLTVVNHRDLLPGLGTLSFDSGHIESYLHHIPGLSERFIYFNDDVFLGSPLNPDWLFGNRLKVFVEATPIPNYTELQRHETALVNASILSKNWLGSRYANYAHDARVFSHAPRPMLKSVMHAFEALAPELFAQVRSTTFRSWHKPAIIPDLIPRWMVHLGYAEQSELNPLYISTADALAEQMFNTLRHRFGTLPFFCINDTCDDAADDDVRLQRISNTLLLLLPNASSFELSAVGHNQLVLN